MAKQIVTGADSRQAILRGVNILADAVKIARPQGAQRGNRKEIRITRYHQGWCDGSQGN